MPRSAPYAHQQHRITDWHWRAWIVADNVVISHRGAAYEIGRGRGFYGIWPAGAPRSQPAEWWPATPAGWSGAWSRFTRLEAPAAIVPVTAAPILKISASTRAIIAAVLLAVGVVFGAGALFPGYIGRPSLASSASELVPHLIYLATWLVATVLILRGGTRLRIGALLAAGTSVVTLGLFFADLATATAGSNLVGAGLVLGLIGWLSCAAGAATAVWIRPEAAGPAHSYQLQPVRWLPAVVVAAIGVAATFGPAWDSFTIHTASGQSQTLTEGNAFAMPGAVIAGDVMVMIGLVAVVVVAGLLRPVRQGGILLLGAVIPMVAQAISAVIQILEPATPAQFGITPAQAALAGITVSSGVTAAFWVYCIFAAAALAMGVRMILPSRPAVAAQVPQPWFPAAGPVPAFGLPVTPGGPGESSGAGPAAGTGWPAGGTTAAAAPAAGVAEAGAGGAGVAEAGAGGAGVAEAGGAEAGVPGAGVPGVGIPGDGPDAAGSASGEGSEAASPLPGTAAGPAGAAPAGTVD
jgi:hypothetical protein